VLASAAAIDSVRAFATRTCLAPKARSLGERARLASVPSYGFTASLAPKALSHFQPWASPQESDYPERTKR